MSRALISVALGTKEEHLRTLVTGRPASAEAHQTLPLKATVACMIGRSPEDSVTDTILSLPQRAVCDRSARAREHDTDPQHLGRTRSDWQHSTEHHVWHLHPF